LVRQTNINELENNRKRNSVLPGIDGAPRPIAPPPETAACATGVGFDIQPASCVGTGAGVGWKGCKHKAQKVPAL
jgi:hypothetical protein